MQPQQSKILRIHINQKAETAIRSRHPWLFSDSILDKNREGELGELAVLYGRKNEFLAMGLYDPESPIRVRILHVGKPVQMTEAWWLQHLIDALKRRDKFFDSNTTGYRLIHGENDGWGGLVLDRYAEVCVLKLYTAAWFSRLGDITKMLNQQLPWCETMILRMSRNLQAAAADALGKRLQDGDIIYGKPIHDRVVFKENAIRFEADVLKGQKTGFFLDQRENRQRVESLSKGREVLNVFSFSGAFSLYAARGGAVSTSDLDISIHALESSERNFGLNQGDARIAKCGHELIQADAFEWLKTGSRMFDMIIVDPPSLAKKESERENARDAYQRLASRAIQKLRKTSILVASSCSAHVSNYEFFETVLQAAKASKRKFHEIERTEHPDDHPATFKESGYLKTIYLRFE